MLNPRITENSNISELTKNGAANPPNSKSIPPIKGPGTVDMLATDSVTPKIFPCSLSTVALDM